MTEKRAATVMCKDLEDMIEVLTIAIAREEMEEEFFRRSAREARDEMARSMFTEIAEEISAYRNSLEMRRKNLEEMKADAKRA